MIKFVKSNLPYIVAACLTAAIGVSASAVLGQDKTDYARKEFCSNNNWSNNDRVSNSELREITLNAGGLLDVDANKNGGISVRGENRSDILVRACVQTWGDSESEAKAAASQVRINTAGTVRPEGPEDGKWSVSFQILVPRATSIKLTANNGGISIAGIDGSAEFSTRNGGVSLKEVAGTIKGRTVNGGINVSLSGASWRGNGLDVETTNGGVRLSLPSTFAAHVETGTVNGGFHSDIPGLMVEKSDGYGRRNSARISTDINGGGPTIRVVTTNGGINISASDK